MYAFMRCTLTTANQSKKPIAAFILFPGFSAITPRQHLQPLLLLQAPQQLLPLTSRNHLD